MNNKIAQDFNKITVLVTGGSGFIGKNLIKSCQKKMEYYFAF